jgi:hypothetical protein
MFWKAKRFGRRASEIFLKRHLRVRVLSPHPRSRGVSRHCAVRSFSACWQPVHMSEFLIARPDIIFGKDRGIYPSPEAYRQAATWNGEFGQCGREAAHPPRAGADREGVESGIAAFRGSKSRSDFSATFTTIAFDDSSLRWPEIDT